MLPQVFLFKFTNLRSGCRLFVLAPGFWALKARRQILDPLNGAGHFFAVRNLTENFL